MHSSYNCTCTGLKGALKFVVFQRVSFFAVQILNVRASSRETLGGGACSPRKFLYFALFESLEMH